MAPKGAAGGSAVHNLLGAPDSDIGNPKVKSRTTQAIRIQLTQDVIRELQKHAKANKNAIQLLLGKMPHLRYGGKTTPLHLTPSNFRTELYHKANEDSPDFKFKALITHSAFITQVQEVTSGADTAVAKLQATLAGLQKQKEENKATFIHAVRDPKKMPPSGKDAGPVLKTAAVKSGAGAGRSSMSEYWNLLAETQAEGAAAKRHSLIHLLAVGPLDTKTAVEKLKLGHQECVAALKKVGKQTDSGSWELDSRYYKELDIWNFNYLGQDRQSAQDNAIRAFDRQRVSREDKLWQMLVSPDNRNKGICLSKLNLNVGSTPQPGKSIPVPQPDTTNPSQPSARVKQLLAGKTSKPPTPKPKKNDSKDEAPKPNSQKRKIDTKVKSAETVHDSDECDEHNNKAPALKDEEPEKKRIKTQHQPTPSMAAKKTADKRPPGTAAKALESSSATSTSAKSTPMHRQSSSNSSITTQHTDKPATIKHPQQAPGKAITPASSTITALKAELNAKFLAHIRRRIAIETAKPKVSQGDIAAYVAGNDEVIALRVALRKEMMNTAEAEYKALVPCDLVLDSESKAFLKARLVLAHNQYSKLRDELEAKKEMEREVVEVKKASRLYKEVMQLRMLLIPNEQ